MYCLPATQCCCGCTVNFGVKFLLVIHFLSCFLAVFGTAGSLIAPGTFGGEIPEELRAYSVVFAIWCLLGMALIIFAWYGMLRKFESLIRLYFVYAAICVVGDIAYIVRSILMPGCSNMPVLLTSQGDAFACGVVRSTNMTVTFLATCLQAYFLFIVWSLCEDMAEGGQSSLGDLAIGMTDDKLRQKRSLVGNPAVMGSWGGPAGRGGYGGGGGGDYGGTGDAGYGGGGYGSYGGGGAGGSFDASNVGPAYNEVGGYGNVNPNYDTSLSGMIFGDSNKYNSAYDQVSGNGIAGAKRIFDGSYHEMSFPPRRA